MAQLLPYNTGFEQDQGFLPGEYSSGPIDTAGGWTVLDGTASVQSLLRFSGTQSLQLQPQALVDSQAGAGATSSLWIQGRYRGRLQEADPDVSLMGPRSALLFFHETDGLKIYEGNTSQWEPAGLEVNEDTWYQITVKLDFLTHTWDLYVDDSLLQSGIGFKDSSIDSFGGFRCQSSSAGSDYLDDFYVGHDAPENLWTSTPSPTMTFTPAAADTFTATFTPTTTPADTFVPTSTSTSTNTSTPSITPTPTATATNVPPRVTLISGPLEGPPPLEVTFIAAATDEDGLLNTLEWVFDTSLPDTSIQEAASATVEETTTHVYTQPGLFEALFRAQDNSGAVAEATAAIAVWTLTPTATVTYTPTSTLTPTFTNTFTPTETSTWTSSRTFTPTASPTPSLTPTPSVTWTPADTPTVTSTPAETLTPTHTPLVVGCNNCREEDLSIALSTHEATSALNVTKSLRLTRVLPEVDIQHPNVHHLTIRLTSPEGTAVTLWQADLSAPGRENLSGVFGDDLPVADGPDALTRLAGQNARGNWILSILNEGLWFPGTLDRWCLSLEGTTSRPGDSNGDGLIDHNDLFFFSIWWNTPANGENNLCDCLPNGTIDHGDLTGMLRHWR
jgi:subtilisin-like proprotein convertase family protein